MYINLKFSPYEINRPTYITAPIKNTVFPYCFIDKDSYIVDAMIETGLDFHIHDNVYNFQIGKYSSLAENILFMIDIDHDYYSVCQGVISEFQHSTSVEITRKVKKRKGEIIIGNDCWIGNGATIMNGVIIHDGAVIAAKSVVTKNVPPYTIVGGNPAKIIKKRFPDETIDALRIIRWWDWNKEKILSGEKYIKGDVNDFARRYLPEALERLNYLSNGDSFFKKIIKSGQTFAYIIDEDAPISSYHSVIKAFCSKFSRMDSQLVLFFPNYLKNKNQAVNKVLQELDKYKDSESCISLIYDDNAHIESVINHCDKYITSRSKLNIYAIGIAELFGKEIISGFNVPIWD